MPCKSDWYQTDEQVVVNLLRLSVDPANCTVGFKGEHQLIVRHAGEELFNVVLAGAVLPEAKVNFTPSKAEIVLSKKTKGPWPSLESKEVAGPSDSRKPRTEHWDQLAKEVDQDPECELDDGVNKFFKQIYSNLDEDGRRAMMKSMTESAGTVLSTNWGEVGKDKVEIKPPEGMEFKKYQ